MENRRETIVIEPRRIPRILAFGLMLNAICIIFSVEQLYLNGDWVQLSIATVLFVVMLLLIRRFNHE